MKARIIVDPIRCDGRGLSAELLPERITLDDWGFPIVDPEPLRRDELGDARRAVRLCPVLALELERVRNRRGQGVSRQPHAKR